MHQVDLGAVTDRQHCKTVLHPFAFGAPVLTRSRASPFGRRASPAIVSPARPLRAPRRPSLPLVSSPPAVALFFFLLFFFVFLVSFLFLFPHLSSVLHNFRPPPPHPMPMPSMAPASDPDRFLSLIRGGRGRRRRAASNRLGMGCGGGTRFRTFSAVRVVRSTGTADLAGRFSLRRSAV
jgi:hypothetical protein